jgi:hypothetical protein
VKVGRTGGAGHPHRKGCGETKQTGKEKKQDSVEGWVTRVERKCIQDQGAINGVKNYGRLEKTKMVS